MKLIHRRCTASAVPAVLVGAIALLFVLLAPSGAARAVGGQVATKKPSAIKVPNCKVSKLVAAIEDANATADADTIELKKGCTYALTIGPYVGDGPNGLPVVTAPLTIHGNGATIARDPASPAFRIVQTQGLAAQDTFALDNLTLRGGSAGEGGAVLIRGGTLKISNSLLTDNSAIRRGGGIFAEAPWPGAPDLTVPVVVNLSGDRFAMNTVHAPDSEGSEVWGGGAVWAIGDGSLTVLDSIFSGNSAQVDGPGAPYAGALAAGMTSGTIARTTFTSNSAPPDGGGGAIYSGASFSVSDCTFTDNANVAIFWEGYDVNPTTLTVTSSTFTHNAGGAISGFRSPASTLSVTNSDFTDNTSPWGGGAIGAMGTTIVSDSTFSSNTAPTGGAILARAPFDSDALSLTVTDTVFTGNASTNPSSEWFRGGGGAINVSGGDAALGGPSAVKLERDRFLDNSAGGLGGAVSLGAESVSVVGSTFASNTAGDLAPQSGNGGAIFSESPGLSITDSTFTQNSAYLGGAVDWEYGGATPHALKVTGSTFSGNSGWVDGLAAMMCAYGQNPACSDVVTVANSTFEQDTVWASRGALHVTSTTLSGGQLRTGDGGPATVSAITLANTILAEAVCSGPTIDGGGNLSFNSSGCPGIVGDPKLLPLSSNGGPTQTMALGPGSAALNAADDLTCGYAIGPPLFGAGGVDQRGTTRPQVDCDIGAYELVVP